MESFIYDLYKAIDESKKSEREKEQERAYIAEVLEMDMEIHRRLAACYYYDDSEKEEMAALEKTIDRAYFLVNQLAKMGEEYGICLDFLRVQNRDLLDISIQLDKIDIDSTICEELLKEEKCNKK